MIVSLEVLAAGGASVDKETNTSSSPRKLVNRE